MKKILGLLVVILMVISLTGCSSSSDEEKSEVSSDVTTYKIGICNYVDDASLNQIVENIKNTLEAENEKGEVYFEVSDKNCNADAAVLDQIISGFVADGVDLMIGVATPVAISMQAATEDNEIPVVFAAVSDPVGAGLVESNEKPGANITGTSDYLDTSAVLNLALSLNPELTKVGLLYDQGQDSSTTAIKEAKAFLDEKGIEYKEYTGTNTNEISLAVDSMAADGIKVAFTPSDNTVMTAELTIYEKMAENNIQHFAGADSFALNGAFVGYGVDYANLGVETGKMVIDILENGKDISTYSVKTFDNGIATVNTEICASLGMDYAFVSDSFTPYCTAVKEITTSEDFN